MITKLLVGVDTILGWRLLLFPPATPPNDPSLLQRTLAVPAIEDTKKVDAVVRYSIIVRACCH